MGITQKFATELLDPKTLTPNAWNSNRVSPENEAKLEESIKRFGMFKPVIVRELKNGRLEIIGGQHRCEAALRLGVSPIPVVNLGRIDDARAKEISLVDNGRYGADDSLRLAELLESLGSSDDLASFMPYSDAEFASIMSSVNIALDDLDLPDEADGPSLPTTPQAQTHQIMRFKVPVEDVAMVMGLIEATMKAQRFTEEDSLTNAGNALVHVCKSFGK